MQVFLDRLNSVEPEPRRAAPNGDVTVTQRVFGDRIGPFQAPELEDGRQSERDRDDRFCEVALVPVLMQRQPRARLVAVDQAGVRREVLISASAAASAARRRKESGMSGQAFLVSGSLRS